MKRLLWTLTVVACLPLGGALARADDDFDRRTAMREKERFQERESREDRERRMRETVELYMMIRMKEVLDLSEQQEESVMPLLREHLAERRDTSQEKRHLAHELRMMLDGDFDEARAADILQRLHGMENDLHRSRDRLWRALGEHLDVRQQARFAFFMDRFAREMQDRVRSIQEMHRRERLGDRPGPRGRRDPGRWEDR